MKWPPHGPTTGRPVLRCLYARRTSFPASGIERLVAMTQLANEAAVNRFQRTSGEGWHRQQTPRFSGAKQGDTVRIGKAEFDFFDEDALNEVQGEEVKAHNPQYGGTG